MARQIRAYVGLGLGAYMPVSVFVRVWKGSTMGGWKALL